jgi:hypothetical protein
MTISTTIGRAPHRAASVAFLSMWMLICSGGPAAADPPGPPGPNVAPGPTKIKACGEITEPGSYVLVDNLSSESPHPCIRISARYVTLDLGGFAILGVGDRVPGFTGIFVQPLQGFEGLTVRNGAVQNFYDGVSLEGAAGSSVENMKVVFNLNNGISLHTGLAKNNVIWANGVGVKCIASLVLQNVFSFGNGTNIQDLGNCTTIDNAF